MKCVAKRVLFVCLGNICRSPAAEEIFRVMAGRAGLGGVASLCDSCGTEDYFEGALPDSRMRAAALLRGYDLRHRARPVRTGDFKDFDLVLPMARDVEAFLRKQCPAGIADRIRPFADYCVRNRVSEIPDPYYGGEEGFTHVLDLLEDGCAELVRQLGGDASGGAGN
ncbi:MAG: low molecular weight phosphotyrosine protein phosphatase [Puniceicoccales bacterium]|nr:low molecular weight phosphotyrosine protein phosphatase [Puniceicoccales bacterium]